MRFWSMRTFVGSFNLNWTSHEAHAIAGDLDGATAHFAVACQLNLLEGLIQILDPQRN